MIEQIVTTKLQWKMDQLYSALHIENRMYLKPEELVFDSPNEADVHHDVSHTHLF